MRFVILALAVSVLASGCNPAEPGGITKESGGTSTTTNGNTVVSGTLNSAGPPGTQSNTPRSTFVTKAATTTSTQSGSATATIALSKASVIELTWEDQLGRPHYVYTPRFVLAETSGRSGARFATMDVFAPGGWHDELCFDPRVNAGSTFDPFNVPENDCYMTDYGTPSGSTDTRASSLTVTLTFVDDQGAPGTVTAQFAF